MPNSYVITHYYNGFCLTEEILLKLLDLVQYDVGDENKSKKYTVCCHGWVTCKTKQSKHKTLRINKYASVSHSVVCDLLLCGIGIVSRFPKS